MHNGEALIPIVMFAGFFAMMFGIVYLRTRQNLAMIEKGMNPKEFANRPAPYKNLKWALLFIGAGIGLFLAYMLDNYVFQHMATKEIINGNTYHHGNEGNPAIYFSLIAIGARTWLVWFLSYRKEVVGGK